MTRKQNDCNWKIGGEAGFGIMATGAIFAKVCMRSGLSVFDYAEYPSLIRGGHNTYQVYVSAESIYAQRHHVDILIALNKETIERHTAELSPGAAIIYDVNDWTLKHYDHTHLTKAGFRVFALPLEGIARGVGGQKVMRNTVALGATFALLSVPFGQPADVVKELFGAKGPAIVEENTKVLRAGYEVVSTDDGGQFPWDIKPLKKIMPHMLVTGNEAIALSAIQAGCQFYAAYPMTPASSILHVLAEHGPQYGMVVRHAEDEIGVINETIGAAFAGARAMCATAGGGFSLMTEAVGLAGMAEVGIVIVEAQRGGPSTGLPTWTEQGDLRQVLHASQGDFLKIVLAPSSHEECVTMMPLAFDLADRYQTPVIVMTDKHLAESHASIPVPPAAAKSLDRGKIHSPKGSDAAKPFSRYATNVADGISPRTLPGVPGGIFMANSDEHDELGHSNEDADMRVQQMSKRARKETTLQKTIPKPQLIGPKQATLTLVTWGSTTGAVRDAMHVLQDHYHITANALVITWINPFPATAVTEILRQAHVTVMIEANQSAQMAGWIRQQTGLSLDHHVLRTDGRPFDPVALAHQLHDLVR